MAIKFASALDVAAQKLSTAEILSAEKLSKKTKVLKKEAFESTEKVNDEIGLLKNSALEEIVNNTAAMWLMQTNKCRDMT